MKKIFYIILGLFIPQSAFANQPVEWQLGFQKAASESMRDIVAFHDNLLLPIIIAISVFVLFLMLYACVRFRASANPNPSKRTHNVTVEVLWTLIPCLILIVMAVPSFKILYKQDAIPKADLTIKAIGYQWYWGYEYPDNGNFTYEAFMLQSADELEEDKPFKRMLTTDTKVVVPVNKIVRMQVTAADVLHSWAIPAFGVKTDAVPGRLNETWFKAEKTGIFYDSSGKSILHLGSENTTGAATEGYINIEATPMQVQQFTPAVRVSTVLDKIFEQAQFTYSSSLQPLFQNLYIMPKQTEDLSVKGAGFSDFGFIANKTGSAQNVARDTNTTIAINNEVYDPTNSYNTSTYKYTVPRVGTYQFSGSIEYEYGDDPPPIGNDLILRVILSLNLLFE